MSEAIKQIELRAEDQTRQQIQRKSSFERFGDDLTEYILQYLPFEDKTRLECVSKQWRDLIYNKQIAIDFRDISRRLKEGMRNLSSDKKLKAKEDHRKRMEILFGKCPHVYRISCENEFILETLIEPIGRYCSRLKSIDFNVNTLDEKEILDFARSYGHKLESLRLNIDLQTNPTVTIKEFLGYCFKLKTIIDIKCWYKCKPVDYLEWFLHDFDANGPTYLPELQHIMPQLFNYPLKTLANRNGLIMKSIRLSLFWFTDEFVNETFKDLIRMKNLQSLSLQCDYSSLTSFLNLSEFGQLPKLKRFELNVRDYYNEKNTIMTDILMIINALINIEKLDFKFTGCMSDIEGEPHDYDFMSLRKLTKLKRLEMAFEFFNYRIHMLGHSLFGSNTTFKNIPEVKVEILNGFECQEIECQNVIAFGRSLAEVYPKTKFEVIYRMV